MSVSTSIDYRRGPRFEPTDLLELYREREPRHPLLLRAIAAAGVAPLPGPELPFVYQERRDAFYDLVYRGRWDDAEAQVAGWLESAIAGEGEEAALELAVGLEALSLFCGQRGDTSDSAAALATALHLHARRTSLPFHGTLLRRFAVALANLGGVDAARLLASEALRFAIEQSDDRGAAYSLAVAQRMASLAQDWPAVLSAAAAARRFLPEDDDLLRYALLSGEANALLDLNRHDEAEKKLEAAAAAFAGKETPLTESFLCWTRGRLRQAQGRHEEAAAEFEKAVQLGRGTQEPLNRYLILLDFAASLEALGRQDELRQHYDQLARELPDLSRFEGSQEIRQAWTDLRDRLGGS